MTRITTHVLDTSAGRPAAGITVRLERLDGTRLDPVASAVTDSDGRVGDWLPEGIRPGRYRLLFETGAWFQRVGQKTIYPEVVVAFEVEGAMTHCHLPLLLAPYGYSTYRGS